MDAETGGLTPQHSLLTLSCIAVDDKFNIVPIGGHNPGLYLRIRHDEYALTAGALAVNQINLVEHNEKGVDVKTASDMLRDFVSRACAATNKKRLVPAGHNVSFDVQFVRACLLNDAQWNEFFTYPFLDTAAVARFFTAAGRYDGRGYSLGVLRRIFVPHTDGQTMHNAETDNLVSIELTKKFAGMVANQN
jgi:DNA polymerase III alpha subunit (gram-positive type)